MAIKVSISLNSPKLSHPKLSIFNFHNLPSNSQLNFPNLSSNGQLKFKSHFKIPNAIPKPHQTLKSKSYRNQISCLFTGIVEEMGKVKELGYGENAGFDLKIGAKIVLEDVKLGDSIAVNGTCLTVTEFNTELSEFTVGLAPETLRKTSLIELQPGSLVNLERALQPSTRMGGHFVQGHVDGTGEIVSLDPEDDSLWVKVKTTPELLKYIVPKGFIAIDGTSLTVVDVFDDDLCFNFMLVAYTQQNVVIPLKKVGQKVNLEVDILGKYVERLLNSGFLEASKSP
ncbi:riboflavin synthase [Amaranthus tricolor]|uniref:riboflavin synthase n=1 Tax=Amaranthus tricolor TaxID=29722 RepID=UPI00258444CA|nr:riboflavin synthase [Amaranthus tricolor]